MRKLLFCAASFRFEAPRGGQAPCFFGAKRPPRQARPPAFSARSAARVAVCPSLPRRAVCPLAVCGKKPRSGGRMPFCCGATAPPCRTAEGKAKRISETRTNTLTFVRIYGIIIWRKRQTAAQTPRAGMQKYPSGSRGSPAKGVVRETVARVQIPPSAPALKPVALVTGFCFLPLRAHRKSRLRATGFPAPKARSPK